MAQGAPNILFMGYYYSIPTQHKLLERKEPNMKIADIIRAGIADGKDNAAILADVKAARPSTRAPSSSTN